MKYLLILCTAGLLFACSEEEVATPKEKIESVEDLTEIKDGVFTQYYPGRKKIKFRGEQDELGQRNGLWYFYSESGVQISMTEFIHGKKNGVSVLYYENGSLQYSGEYENDKPVGIWKTYNEKGELIDTKDYTALNEEIK